MNKFSKIILPTPILFPFSLTPQLFNPTQPHPQNSIQPYYNYHPYTPYQTPFILHKNFKHSFKYHNFTINPYQISNNTTPHNPINLYHQTLYGV
ncbi:immunodominant staphylococcal antigen IsaB family protein, partial [Staphylococcus capitis]